MDKVSDTPKDELVVGGAIVALYQSAQIYRLERELAAQKEHYRVLEEEMLVLCDEKNAAVRDAERYRWLRVQKWYCSPLAVVTKPIEAIKLVYECPSGSRLDALIDDSMREMK